jgi:hypothetical protein
LCLIGSFRFEFDVDKKCYGQYCKEEDVGNNKKNNNNNN